ncbi:MAG: hypothetical protein ACFFDN_37465 [Candidatus Hodarchaeota archaeon]
MIIRKTTIVFTFLLIIGCGTSPIQLSSKTTLSQSEGIVYDRVKVIEGGTEKKLEFLGESHFGLIILCNDTHESIYVPLHGTGEFYWHLQEGTYIIASFEWNHHGILSGRIFTRFSVLENKSNYIGTLVLRFSSGGYRISIDSEFENSTELLLDKFPNIKNEIIVNLMKKECKR